VAVGEAVGVAVAAGLLVGAVEAAVLADVLGLGLGLGVVPPSKPGQPVKASTGIPIARATDHVKRGFWRMCTPSSRAM
jgi:hypothetical protein